jgi:hypothetical protein
MDPLHIIENLNKESYSEFMKRSPLPYIEKHYDDSNILLLHDNHPTHNSNHVKKWIDDNIGPIEDFVLPHPR